MEKFIVYNNMEGIVDSMQLDSGTIIAELYRENGDKVYLRTRGDVEVRWKSDGKFSISSQTYTQPSLFPKDLKDLIANQKAIIIDEDVDCTDWTEDIRVCVENYNWFEFLYETKNKEIYDTDVIDIKMINNIQNLYNCFCMFINYIDNTIKEERGE